jgi:hypothetical protein
VNAKKLTLQINRDCLEFQYLPKKSCLRIPFQLETVKLKMHNLQVLDKIKNNFYNETIEYLFNSYIMRQNPPFLCLCILCLTIILNLHPISAAGFGSAHLFSGHLHSYELDEDVLILTLLVVFAFGAQGGPLITPQQVRRSFYTTRQFPPPKTI